MMMFDHLQPAEYVLDRLSFEHDKKHYTGRGILTWDPEKGIHINAFLNQRGPDTRFQSLGTVQIQDGADQHSVRFTGYGFRGVIPKVFQQELGSSLHERRVSIRSENAIFFRRFGPFGKEQTDRKWWHGVAVYVHEQSFDFPDQLHTAVTLNGEAIQYSTSRGLSYEENGLSIWGRKTGDNFFTVSWSLSSLTPKSYCWNLAEAYRRALSILSGQTVWLVKREMTRGVLEITELRRKREVEVLNNVHRPLNDMDPSQWTWNKSAFIKLFRFFASDDPNANVCWPLFRRLTEASRQDTWESRELVQATALEAALRTLDNHPFSPGDRSWSLRPSLQAFFRRYLDSKWSPVCTRVLEVQKRLRHRNAHPDWITHASSSSSKPEWRQSIEDLTYLSRFYGYMILGLAGFNDIEPKFPQVRFK